MTPERGVGTRDISIWIRKSKPTVIKYMWEMVGLELVTIEVEKWRPGVATYRYFPTKHVVEMWQEGMFSLSWGVHKETVLNPLKRQYE